MAERVRWSDFWFLYGQTLKQMRRPVLWAPLLLQGILALGLAAMHYYLFSPLTGPLLTGWLRLVQPEYASAYFHYPQHFIFLPYFWGYARLVVGLFTEALFLSVTIDMLMALYHGQSPLLMISFRRALAAYLRLTLVWAVVIIVLYLVNRYALDIVQSVLGYSLESAPRRQLAASAGLRVLTVLIYAPCMYLLPSLMRGRGTVGEMISQALRVALRHPFISLGLAAIPYLIGLPPSWAAMESSTIVSNFYPELVYLLVLLTIIIDVPVNFLLLGTSVKFFMDQSE